MKRVEIIVPVFNEEEGITIFRDEVKKVINKIEGYEFGFIFVNDGSLDNTLSVIKEIAKDDDSIKFISFSRNFGKEAAIYAGLKASHADYTILIDSDLQHPPALIPLMLKAVEEEGYGAAGAKRKTGFFSRMFVGLNNKLSSVKLQKGATDYMCMTRAFLDAVLKLSETQRFSKGLFAWVGFKVKWLDYEQPDRIKGKSKWSFTKLFSYATSGITSFSVVPLRLATVVGVIVCILSFIYIIITLIQTLIFGIDVPGYVTTLVILLFLGGLIILSVGILGEYIGQIYLESKNRPLYILEETNIEKEDKKSVNDEN